MLSDSEQRRLAEIESRLSNEDPAFVHRFGRRTREGRARRRRWIAVLLALCGVIVAVAGLTGPYVPVVVLAMCSIGVAGGIATWRPSPE